MTEELTGLLASIYKDRGKAYSNGGISERYDEVLVVGDGIEGPFKERNGLPIVQIVPGHRGGYRAIPVLGWDGYAIVRGRDGRAWFVGANYQGPYLTLDEAELAVLGNGMFKVDADGTVSVKA